MMAAVEIVLKEYGWTIDYLKSLDIPQFLVIIKYINRRYANEARAAKAGSNKGKKGFNNKKRR